MKQWMNRLINRRIVNHFSYLFILKSHISIIIYMKKITIIKLKIMIKGKRTDKDI